MSTPQLPPSLDAYFQRLRAGAAVAWVLFGLAGAAALGAGAFVLNEPRFEAWTLATLIPAVLIGLFALKVHRRVSHPLQTPEAQAILTGTLRAFYVRQTKVKAVGVDVGSLFSIILELPDKSTAYLNPLSEEERASLLRELKLQCPQARDTPPG